VVQAAVQVPGQGGEAKSDGFCMLAGCIEGVVQVHQECVTAPPEAVFDVGVQEPCAVKEVRSRDAD
jgi:hypothetical protein